MSLILTLIESICRDYWRRMRSRKPYPNKTSLCFNWLPKSRSYTDTRFSGTHCEQLETDIKNPPHGFSPKRTHLAVLRYISPETEGF